ncbi:acyltransferase family-domain-containing protein [Cadophora sp. MPI-SDFR-AT-0126]|nr:acyltransferase family-domain-containing protein [Leotiomycetes sp. MPI-SDFR-AT-0126]
MGILNRLFTSILTRYLHRYELLLPGEAGSDTGHELELEDERKDQTTTNFKHAWVIQCAKTTAVFLTPSFLQRSGEKVERKITETSYLNGVRGLAASLVYVQHSLFAVWIHNGYRGLPGDSYWQLPFMRLLYSGRFMVSIFFILSGYVLSYRPLQLARKSDSKALYDNLSSATFRRIPRLFLPVVPAMLGTATTAYFTCYGAEDYTKNRCFPKATSLWRQWWGYVPVLTRMLDPSVWTEYYPPGVPHLWTLPMEFRGSMVVFLLVLGLGNTRALYRLFLLSLFAVFFLHLGKWDTFLFTCGTVLAELRISRAEAQRLVETESQTRSIPSGYSGSKRARALIQWRVVTKVFWTMIFITGLFLGSWPAYHACSSVGFRHFCTLTPTPYNGSEKLEQYFWISIGAVLLLLSLENMEKLQRPFTTRLASYMGDISFGFYIVHWTMLFSVGTLIIGNFRRWLPYGYPNYSLGFFVGLILTTPFVVWVGDINWRAFDNGAVKCARWLNTFCTRK